MARVALSDVVEALAADSGEPSPPVVVDAFEQTVFEACAYLVDDARRLAVFENLRAKCGMTPAKLLAAGGKRIAAAIVDGGMRPPMRAAKVLRSQVVAVRSQVVAELVNLSLDDSTRRADPGPAVPNR